MSALFRRLLAVVESSSACHGHPGRALCVLGCASILQLAAGGGSAHAQSISVSATYPECHSIDCAGAGVASGWMQFKGSGIVTIESRMSPFYNGATGGFFVYSPNNPFNCKGNEPLDYFNRIEGSDLHYRQTWRLYDCDSGTFQLVTGPQAYYGALWAYDQWPQTNTATFEWTPLDPTPSTISMRPDQAGAPRDNEHTKFLPELDCRKGLPQYSVNTSFLNLVIEDTDFGCQSFGHDASLRRVWNMRPEHRRHVRQRLEFRVRVDDPRRRQRGGYCRTDPRVGPAHRLLRRQAERRWHGHCLGRLGAKLGGPRAGPERLHQQRYRQGHLPARRQAREAFAFL